MFSIRGKGLPASSQAEHGGQGTGGNFGLLHIRGQAVVGMWKIKGV